MSYQVRGELIKKYDLEKVSETFQKRDIVIDTGGEYPQQVKFQCSQMMADIVDRIPLNTMITIHFSLRGKAWNDTHITNLNCYKIEGYEKPAQISNEAGAPAVDTPASNENGEDLPF